MNETEQIESVFGGKKSADSANGAGDKDARIAELERELQKERVESGRLKKTNEELAHLREEVARLKERKGVDSVIESVPEDVRNDIAPEVLRASGTMANRAAAEVAGSISKDIEKQNEEIRMLREENQRRDRVAFTQRINMQFPGFMSSVSEGGDKHDAWIKYQRYNAGSIVSALNANDFDTIAYHIERFCNELGVPVPSGKGGSATPDPRSLAGGTGTVSVNNGRIYTPEEYNALFDQKEAARDRGDYAEVKRISDEINRAQAEGRIKS